MLEVVVVELVVVHQAELEDQVVVELVDEILVEQQMELMEQ
tara:strand:+ start:425 stop:547 length:123 start_codon:yes stop_codon:yes gene_type:complete